MSTKLRHAKISGQGRTLLLLETDSGYRCEGSCRGHLELDYDEEWVTEKWLHYVSIADVPEDPEDWS